MTENACVTNEDAVVISAGVNVPFNENIIARKTIVYETLVDPDVIRISAENLKDQLFSKYGFLKPAPGEVKVVSVERYYDPFIKVSGRYCIDYYRRRMLTVNVSDGVSEVAFPFARYKVTQVQDPSGKPRKVVVLEAEEQMRHEVSATLALDASGKDVTFNQLTAAPSERNPEEILTRLGQSKISESFDVNMLRTRIQKRPEDVSWVANETFEVNERLLIYVPKFRVVFKNIRSGKERVAEYDGVTGRLIRPSDPQLSRASV